MHRIEQSVATCYRSERVENGVAIVLDLAIDPQCYNLYSVFLTSLDRYQLTTMVDDVD